MTTAVPTTRPPGEGWLIWCRNVYGYVEVETWRKGSHETGLVDPRAMHPATNVYGLYWRPAGPQLTQEAMKHWVLFGTALPADKAADRKARK